MTVIGGGNNDRTAARLKRGGWHEKDQWEKCEFEDLRHGDIALFFEKDGTLVRNDDGEAAHYIFQDPYVKDDGIWTVGGMSIQAMARTDVAYVEATLQRQKDVS